MAETYTQVMSKLVESVLKENNKSIKYKKKADLADFIKELFKFTHVDDLEKYGSKNLYNAAKETFEFIQNRPKGTHKIRIYTPNLKQHGWKSEETIVELVNDDMPFLVDSITEEIVRNGLKIYQLAHPVVEVERNKKGEYQSFSSLEKGVAGKNAESVMHFRISHVSKPQEIKILEKNLLRVLKAIQFAVDDWKDIVKKMSYVTTEFAASVETFSNSHKGKKHKDIKETGIEIREFLEWLKDNNFVFLGYVEYQVATKKKQKILDMVHSSRLGVFKLDDSEVEPTKYTVGKITPVDEFNLIDITKANKKSLVHRPVHMDYITIKRFDPDGNLMGEHRFLGMFTSVVYHQTAKTIPLIRKKIKYVQKKSGFSESGHNGKALVAILEDFPRDELFQTSEKELLNTAMGIVSLSIRPRVRLFVRQDELERFISCIIYIPRDRMSTDLRNKMETILAEEFNGAISNHYTQITESHLARLQVIVKTNPGQIPAYNTASIEDKLTLVAKRWEDGLYEELKAKLRDKEGEKIFDLYKEAFSLSYKNSFSAEDAYYDIKQMLYSAKDGKVKFDFYVSENDDSEIFNFKIYSPGNQISLSNIMPIIENMGLHTIDEHTYLVFPDVPEKSMWIHRFRFTITVKRQFSFREIKKNFESAVEKVWAKDVQNDGLNKLILWAGLEWRQVVLIRAYNKYLQQAGFIYSQTYIQEALGNHPELVKMLVELFFIRFDPSYSKDREVNKKRVIGEIEKILGRVSNLAEDRVVRAIVELILATYRSNYFQKNGDDGYKNYISFKFNSASISFLPKPRPFVEIFVYSPRVEGIHLRGGKVARGGLRWSDRREDFRTEVLGLMKAQMTKNSVIIPVGSKGGFVVKRPPDISNREAFINEGVECYKIFLRGLLDITDNMVVGKISPPKNVVRYDEDDPYLVVAADKGTATFSDIANSVSAEYNFWLTDAFASGGSVGYDHKKMGITAKGAWISVQRHFSEMEIDVQKEDFTVVGIGDMAGDVFGNGMLSSRHIKLVGAFNHLHIFLDPNPNAAESFKERKRIFNLSRSSWRDYNPKLISKGGGGI